MHLPWNEQTSAAISDIEPGVIVEGVRVPNILRRGADDGSYIPDICIWCEIDIECLDYCYLNDPLTDMNKVYQFNTGIETVFYDWYNSGPNTELIEIETSFEIPKE